MTFLSLQRNDLLLLLPFICVAVVRAAAGPQFPCNGAAAGGSSNIEHPFCNVSLPVDARARALVSSLTLAEKIEQLSNSAAAVPRLGLPPYEWWSESLHGIASNGPGVAFNGTVTAATGFPQVILSAAAFNKTLWRAIATAIAIEARAMYNVGQAGLTFWAPNINVFRDPRWGRGQETPGEDPLVVSAYAVEYVKGFQGEDSSGSMMLSACCKHFTAYDLEKWYEFNRYNFNAKVTEQDFEDTYQPPFKSCIQEGQASCLMCSYNQVNGVPACARSDLLQKARDDWGLKGYITSDCDAVAVIYENQNYTKSPEDAVALVLKSGIDINCGTYTLRHAWSAIQSGKLEEEDIDRALINLYSVQLRLGLFNGDPAMQQYGHLGPGDICTKEHRDLALDAARQGLVLLKNDNNRLPLEKDSIRSIAVIGPAANDTYILGGDYTGNPCESKSLFDEFHEYMPNSLFASGCLTVPCNSSEGFGEATDVARIADVVVVVAGLNLTEETEDLDRLSLLLPGKQADLVNAIADVIKHPLVLILMGGGPLDVSFAKTNPKIGSILWIGYPGEGGGKAVVEALFGKFNPGGRLPVTWYPESFTKVPMSDMNMRADPSRGYPGRTYRFYTGEVVYRFGYGLSYSNYTFKFLSAPKTIKVSQPTQILIDKQPAYIHGDGLDFIHVNEISSCEALKFVVRISVLNDGNIDGRQTVLMFLRSRSNIKGSPQKQLIGFERVFTRAGKETEAEIVVDPCKHFSIVNVQGKRVLPLGAHVLMLEDSEHVLFIEA